MTITKGKKKFCYHCKGHAKKPKTLDFNSSNYAEVLPKSIQCTIILEAGSLERAKALRIWLDKYIGWVEYKGKK